MQGVLFWILWSMLYSIMMTSSNRNIFLVTGPLCGEFTGPGEFPTQSPVTRSFDIFFDLRLNKRLSKQPRGWWFETLSWSSWRHCNDTFLSLDRLLMSNHRLPSNYSQRRAHNCPSDRYMYLLWIKSLIIIPPWPLLRCMHYYAIWTDLYRYHIGPDIPSILQIVEY